MARGHYIQQNHNTETIHDAIWFDTETDSVEIGPQEIAHVLRQGWSCYRRYRKGRGWSKPDWKRFTSIEAFWDWVESKTRPRIRLHLFCHNSNFDYPVLDTFNELPRRGWEARRIICEAPPTIIQLRKNTSTLLLMDTLNWWRTPLRAMGESIALPKLYMPDNNATEEEWDTYNKRDVEIIMQMVIRWQQFLLDNDMGGFAPTLASQAMRTFRHKYMKHKILIDNNEQALECSREAYHGGRTEAWFIGKTTGDFYLLDINGMYPWVMDKYEYPTKLAYYTCVTHPKDLKAMLKKYLVCARVRVRTTLPIAPKVMDGRLCFPVGEFDCALSTPQLRILMERGEIIKVYDMAMYESAPIFRGYVRDLYTLRRKAADEGDPVSSYMYKIMLNSLYGKFGQKGLVFQGVDRTTDMNPGAWEEYDRDTGESHKFRQLMGVIMKQSSETESANSHPAIAAHVCAYASTELYQMAQQAGVEHVYYMDTDSLLVDGVGFRHLRDLQHETRLGGLKLEGRFNEIEIHGAKDYVFGSRCKVKGVRATALWTSPVTVEQEKWSGLRGMIRQGNISAPVTKILEKRLSRTYKKGQVTVGGRVEPLCLTSDTGF